MIEDLENEIWRDIDGYDGLYKVSNFGRIKSLERIDNQGRIVKEKLLTYDASRTYYAVTLSKNGKSTRKSVHRLVAEAFLPNPDNLPQVNHKDEDKHNNAVDNLEWITVADNNTYGTRLQKTALANGTPVYQKTLNGEIIREWDSLAQIESELGYSRSVISNAINGKVKTAYGYRWSKAPKNIFGRRQNNDGTICYEDENDKADEFSLVSLFSTNTSGVTGVNWLKKNQKWRAYINVGDKQINLGSFVDKEDAIKARKEAEIKYGRRFKNVNQTHNEEVSG